MNRIAITVGSSSLDVEIEPRSGRSSLILLVDPDTMTWESLVNPGSGARGGAGVRVAQVLSNRKVSDVVSGEFGPKAYDALRAARITMHRFGSGTTAREAVELLKAGKVAGTVPATRPRRGRRGRGQ